MQTLHKYYAGVLERLVVVNPPFGAKAIFKVRHTFSSCECRIHTSPTGIGVPEI